MDASKDTSSSTAETALPPLPEPRYRGGVEVSGRIQPPLYTEEQVLAIRAAAWKAGYKHGAWANQPGSKDE